MAAWSSKLQPVNRRQVRGFTTGGFILRESAPSARSIPPAASIAGLRVTVVINTFRHTLRGIPSLALRTPAWRASDHHPKPRSQAGQGGYHHHVDNALLLAPICKRHAPHWTRPSLNRIHRTGDNLESRQLAIARGPGGGPGSAPAPAPTPAPSSARRRALFTFGISTNRHLSSQAWDSSTPSGSGPSCPLS